MMDTSSVLPIILLNQVLPHLNGEDEDEATAVTGRPVVTLTYAQSLDGKIAGRGGQQLILSGTESMGMTHWMRTMHDAILVGIGTAINDDPQLNTRRLPPREDDEPYPQPIPIVVDTHLRLPLTCKLITNHAQGKGRQPWVICGSGANPERKAALEQNGVKILEVARHSETGPVDIDNLLTKLHAEGVKSLMVEGGQRIISSFLAHRDSAKSRSVVDTLIITVAPVLVGIDGVGAIQDDQVPPKLNHVTSVVMGRDTVVVCRLSSKP